MPTGDPVAGTDLTSRRLHPRPSPTPPGGCHRPGAAGYPAGRPRPARLGRPAAALDFDEPVYLQAGLDYAEALRANDWAR
jgi:hypothetical protein